MVDTVLKKTSDILDTLVFPRIASRGDKACRKKAGRRKLELEPIAALLERERIAVPRVARNPIREKLSEASTALGCVHKIVFFRSSKLN